MRMPVFYTPDSRWEIQKSTQSFCREYCSEPDTTTIRVLADAMFVGTIVFVRKGVHDTMSIFYGLDIPLMMVLLLIWGLLAWLSGRLRFVADVDHAKKQGKTIRVLIFIVCFVTVLLVVENALNLGFFLEKDKILFHFMFLLTPLLCVLLFSFPKTKRLYAMSDKLSDEESRAELRRITTDVAFVLPFQCGAYTMIIHLCFLLFPHGIVSFIDYLIPCIVLLVVFTILWLYYRYQQRGTIPLKKSLVHRLIRTSLSVCLVLCSLGAFLTATVMSVLSNGAKAEEHREKSEAQTGFVTTEGDDIYYEVRGEGSPLLMIAGGGGDAGFYTFVADILADEYQVITYDRRGNSRSTRNNPHHFDISQQARDAVAVLHATHHDAAFVFGNSGGALIALKMAENHPDAVKAVVVHESPVLTVLPDHEKWTTFFSRIHQAANFFGADVANTLFSFSVGIPASAFTHIPEDFQERNAGNTDILIKDEMQSFVRYMPDIEKIRNNSVKVMLAAGELSLQQERYYARTAPILAEQLNARLVLFPGHHLSYFDMPEEWAETLRVALQEE